jgi:poly-gamma-glutamate synthesis protein (capsule biosynthesis protein)
LRTFDRVTWITLTALALCLLTLPGCQTSNATPAPSITFALLGDVMLGRDVHPTTETFAYLKPYLISADLSLANLESPLTNAPTKTASSYVLCGKPANVHYLVDAGIDLLSLANNHNLDCGRDGLTETQRTLTDAGLGFIGPEPKPVYHSINGIRLAFLAFDATTHFDTESAVRAVRSAREKGAIVIVSIHWGVEYQSGASNEQKQIAAQLAEAGASLIWGHHPHVLQPAEWTDDHKTLVLYSLGNAIFDQYGLESTRRSALVLVTLDPSGVWEYKVIPFLIDIKNSQIVEPRQRDVQLIKEYFN